LSAILEINRVLRKIKEMPEHRKIYYLLTEPEKDIA